MEKVVERFVRYVKEDTQSDPKSEKIPSTPGQRIFAEKLAAELKQVGLKDIELDGNGYLMATLPANTEKKVPVVGFIAHVDTSPDFSGKNVTPRFVENYDGGDIELNCNKNIVLSPDDFPELKNYLGETLIVTDGNTLLGADDKAGIAGIVTAMEYLIQRPEIEHGKIRIGFTPDEEIGQGADYFDVQQFGADFAYTIDGGRLGELQFENFNAVHATVTCYGRSVHPGYAKNKMRNSMLIANRFIGMLPASEIPEKTGGYEGFFHLISMAGEIEKTELEYIIRDFEPENMEKRKKQVLEIVRKLNKAYGEEVVTVKIKHQYNNMREQIEPVMHIVEIAKQAMLETGVGPVIVPVRGGTDGARLSYMGLPCPNIFAGGHNFHGKYEYIPVNSMNKTVEVIIKIVENVAKS